MPVRRAERVVPVSLHQRVIELCFGVSDHRNQVGRKQGAHQRESPVGHDDAAAGHIEGRKPPTGGVPGQVQLVTYSEVQRQPAGDLIVVLEEQIVADRLVLAI